MYPLKSREVRLRFAAQAAGFGVYDLDCATGESVWSPELRTMAGLISDNAHLSTEQVEALIHPEDRQRFMDKLQASLDPEGSGEFEDEYRLLRSDGSFRWVRTKGRTFFEGEGESRLPLAATGIVMDLTASRAAAQQLVESRTELERMAEAAIDSIVTIDADQRIIRFNPSAERMFGCTAAQALGSRVERFMPQKYRATHAEKVSRFAEGLAPAQALDSPRRFTGLRMNGEEFPFEATLTKVSVDGNIRMTTFMRDISDRLRAEEALRRSLEYLELAVRGADIGVWTWDAIGGRYELSERCRQLFGIPDGQGLSYNRILAAMHPDDRKPVQSARRRALRECGEYKVEKRFIWPDGSVHWIESIGRAFRDPSTGKTVGLRGIALDITERKLREADLEHRAEYLKTAIENRTRELVQTNAALEQFRIFIEQAPSNIAMFDKDMNYQAASLGWCRAMGVEMRDIIGRNHYEIHGDIPEKWKEAHRTALSGTPLEMKEDLWVRADGGIRWMHWGAYPWRDKEGDIGGIVIAGEDITQRKEAEQQLQESEIRFRSTFEQVAVGLAHVSLEGKLLRVNAKFSDIVGHDPKALLHTTFQEITHPDDLQEDLEKLAQLLAGQAAGYTMEKRYIRKDGNSIWCNLTVSLVRTPTGEPGYFVSVVEDIQARKEAEREIQRFNAELEQRVRQRTAELEYSNEALLHSNMELQHFAHATAHDLKTPLRSIVGFAQLLQQETQEGGSEQAKLWSSQVIDNTRRLQTLIESLLAYTRLDAQGMPFEPVDLRDVADEVTGSLAMLIQETSTEVYCEYLPTLPVDRVQIAQVLQNLVENGIKYNKSKPPKIRIDCEFQDDEWVFSVADNGIGIDSKHHERVFEVFCRLHTYGQVPGTGIGLALCRRIVERHGGRMWVDSRPGEGSTFYFALPFPMRAGNAKARSRPSV